ncbi:translational activator for mitochondrial COX1 [Elasticomyces elasticus]|uniref:Translational activator for mitochondrial COX1 n=1 Tax=Elasticomyces elasticus TaxID=574655 RepID=A0AAN8A695_9PEZI|nr:translational activator for mitochondrial COX1 [Elasticomyces elasticus]
MSDVVPNKNVIKRVCGVCGAGPDISLSRCVQCKSVWYCGKECQKKDWRLHKKACETLAVPDLEEGTLAVLNVPNELLRPYHRYPALVLEVTSATPGSDSYQLREAYYKCSSTSDPLENSQVFKELPLTTVLGYPLLVTRQPEYGNFVPNIFMDYLSVDPDPKSPTFGQKLFPSVQGGLLLVRRDGKHMHKLHIIAIVAYAKNLVLEIFKRSAGREGKGETVDRVKLAEKFLTPKGPATIFEGLLRVVGSIRWMDLDCPFKSEPAAASS